MNLSDNWLEHYSKKISPYLDGQMKGAELQDFEEKLNESRELAARLVARRTEDERLRQMIPEAQLEAPEQKSLESELKEVVQHLFKDTESTPSARLGQWLKNLF